jgi:cell pole-organizing protein PopZ
MSRDSSGESLESILASIRRSLAEQATSVLDDDTAAPVDPPVDGGADLDAPPVPASLSQHLATMLDARQDLKGASADPSAPAAARPAPQATSGLPPGDTPAPAADTHRVDPAPAAPAAEMPQESQKDPLWFLGQEQAPKGPATAPKPILDRTGAPPPPALGAGPAPDAKPSPLGAVRGPLPPFFGSSPAEVVKVAFVPDSPVRKGAAESASVPPASPLPPHPFERAVNAEAPPVHDAPPPTADRAATTMRASSIFPPGDATRPGGAGEVAMPQIQALEAMVAELLRPMLRRWLDENMPRLVSAALKAEAELMSRRDPGRDAKKP